MTFLGLSDDKGLQLACASAAARTLAPSPCRRCGTANAIAMIASGLPTFLADFREHAVAFQLAPLIERHDRQRFQVIGISTGPSDDSGIRARLIKGFDRFHDLPR